MALLRTKCLALLFLPLAAQPPARAQELREPLTLERAQDLGADSNPRVLRAAAAVLTTRGTARTLGALSDPEVWYDFEGEEGVPFGSQRFGLTQVLEFPGKRGLQGRIGSDAVDMEAERLAMVRNQVRAAIAEPFYQVARNDAALRSFATLDTLFVRLLEITRTRYAAGRATYDDVLRVQIERTRVAGAALRARGDRAEQVIVLDVMLGRPVDHAVDVSGDVLRFDSLPGPRAEFVAGRLAESHSLRIARTLTIQRARALALARKANLPDFTFDASLQHDRAQVHATYFSGGIALTLPLWRTRQAGLMQEARGESEEAAIGYREAEARVAGEAARAYEAAAALADEVQLFENRLLPQIEAGLESAIQAYGLGQTEILDVIDLVRTLRETRLEHLGLLADYLASRARLAYAGDLEQE